MPKTNLEIARDYIALFDDPTADPERLKDFLSPDVVYEEMPNLLAPQGSTRGFEQMIAGVRQGKDLLSEQSYAIDRAISDENVVALEVRWQGELAIGFGNVDKGTKLTARIAMLLTFAEGMIIHQRNYDAYDPIG